MYFAPMGEFPLIDVLECFANERLPYVVLTPPSEGRFSEELLMKSVKAASELQVECFVSIYPLSVGTSFGVDSYLSFFRRASGLFNTHAPKAAIVWTAENDPSLMKYYPGDGYVDWVGLNMRQDVVKNADGQIKAPDKGLESVEYFYYTYQGRKPIMLNLAVSHYSSLDNQYYLNEAADVISKVYRDLAQYPGIKGIVYMDYSKTSSIVQNYLITEDETLKAAYIKAMENGLTAPVMVSPDSSLTKSPFYAYKYNGRYFISAKSVKEELGINPAGYKEIFIDDDIYIDAGEILPGLNRDIYENPAQKSISILFAR